MDKKIGFDTLLQKSPIPFFIIWKLKFGTLLTSFLQHYNKDHIHYLHWVVEICGSHSARLLLLEGFFFSCVGMKARPTAKMPWAYLFCKNNYNTIGFLYTIK